MKLVIKAYNSTSIRNNSRTNSTKINGQLTFDLKDIFGKYILFKYDRELENYTIEVCETLDSLSHKDCKKIGKCGNFSVRLTELEEGEYNVEKISDNKFLVFK